MTATQALIIAVSVVTAPYVLGGLMGLFMIQITKLVNLMSFEARQERLYTHSRRYTGGHD